MTKYIIEPSRSFERDMKTFNRNLEVKARVVKALALLAINPFNPILQTHLVNNSSLGRVWSSKITGDLRLLWVFNRTKSMVIVVIKL